MPMEESETKIEAPWPRTGFLMPLDVIAELRIQGFNPAPA